MKKRRLIEDMKPDYGTDELRARHITQIIPTENAGKVAIKIEDECLLDKLLISRRLGPFDDKGNPGEQTKKRYDAGIWLRSLYDRAGLRQRTTMAYAIFGQAAGGGEMSDVEAWNWRVWCDTMRATAQYRYVLVEACVFDRIPGIYHANLARLTDGLDSLAEHRGI